MQTKAIDDLILQRSRFLQFLRGRVDTPSTAEDILQSAYIRAMERSSTLNKTESAVAWFYRILRNAVIDYYRHRDAEDRALERWASDLAAEAAPDTATQNIVCRCIEQVLPAIKPQYSEIIREVDLGEGTLDSFARSAGITPGNAAVRVHRARRALKKQLALACGTCAEHRCVDCTCS
ncbi:MAG TPA: sigma-70 family RNA polymerase sigma factor [Edaphobacter sp.]|nr:sigma-70 family RNA polymerase sigma factor [Edaphobacter sp.]